MPFNFGVADIVISEEDLRTLADMVARQQQCQREGHSDSIVISSDYIKFRTYLSCKGCGIIYDRPMNHAEIKQWDIDMRTPINI